MVKISNIKKIFIIFGFLMISAVAAVLDDCYKIYPTDADNLFMGAISVLGSNSKYEISEIQTKNGYILFYYNQKFYLLTVTKRYKNQSEIKILPQNSDYTQGNYVAREIFSLLDKELKTPMGIVK